MPAKKNTVFACACHGSPPSRIGANLTPDGAMNWGISPHPVPLPMGEGTVEQTLRIFQRSLLPWGEGQDEGREPRSLGNKASDNSYVSAYAPARGRRSGLLRRAFSPANSL